MASGPLASGRPGVDRVRPFHRLRLIARRAWDSNITGLASMLAYTMLLGIVPVALLGLFVAGQVLSSQSVLQSVEHDLQTMFPGATKDTLHSLLEQVAHSTTGSGLLALGLSLWLASSFWGALDTSFSRIYRYDTRPWISQKLFGLVMVVVVLLFMLATVLIPTAQSLLRTGASHLPFGIGKLHALVYAGSLAGSMAILFCCLAVIYATVPNRWVPWHGVWPGALAATIAIGIVDFAFPLYLSSISTIAKFGTTIVFILIVLGWFYVVALLILIGGVMNAVWLDQRAGRA